MLLRLHQSKRIIFLNINESTNSRGSENYSAGLTHTLLCLDPIMEHFHKILSVITQGLALLQKWSFFLPLHYPSHKTIIY